MFAENCENEFKRNVPRNFNTPRFLKVVVRPCFNKFVNLDASDRSVHKSENATAAK